MVKEPDARGVFPLSRESSSSSHTEKFVTPETFLFIRSDPTICTDKLAELQTSPYFIYLLGFGHLGCVSVSDI